MNIQEIHDLLKRQFNEDILELVTPEAGESYIIVAPENILDIMQFCRDYDPLNFDYLTDLTGVDAGDKLGVVYRLSSLELKHEVLIKTFLPKDNPNIHTVERLWRAADWHERETYDMYGVTFEGHHNMIRILCPYDWEGHPLRKDYVPPQEYHGMKVPY